MSPGLLTISLGLGHSFVLVLHGLHVHVFLHGGLVFEHASHAGNGVSLHCIRVVFRAISISLIAVFTVLLIAPIFLGVGVNLHALLVYYRHVSLGTFTYIDLLLQIV